MNTGSRSSIIQAIGRLDEALRAGDIEAAGHLFGAHGYWRDIVSFTWNIKTMEGDEKIKRMLKSCLPNVAPRNWRVPEREEVVQSNDVLECAVEFETKTAHCAGRIRIRAGKIWTLLTTAKGLKGFEERQGRTRPAGLTQGVMKDRKTWTDKLNEERVTLGKSTDPYVLIIGGGQGGIALAARLRQLSVPTLVLDRNEHPGDSWRKRYSTLTLQDPVWYDHLPYLEFPANWPIYSPKDKIADWLEMYSKIMEINFWGSTEVIGAEYDSADASWTIRAEREGKNIELRAKHLVLATGVSGRPYEPIFSGMANFKGEQHHSSKHPGPHAYIGKNALVVGSSNSAHDIAQALWEVGANVTLVQRSSTLVVKQSSLMEFGLKRLYSEDALSAGINVETADMMNASIPYALIPDFHRPTNRAIQQKDEVFYKDLSKVGFQVSWGADNNTGVFSHYLSRGAGYYIDIGASDLIINGSIKLKSQVDIAEIGEKYVRFSDGSELSADLIVYATGYTPMQGLIVELLGREVAEKVGQVWGLGSGMRGDPGPWEGELRNMWKPTRQSALWFHGGNLAQSRFYSQFLALQLKARFEGIAIPVFGVQEVEPITLSR